MCDDSEVDRSRSYKDSDSASANCVRPVLQCRRHEKFNNGKEKNGKAEMVDSLKRKFEPQIRWLDLIAILYVHVGALYGLYLLIASRNIKNFIWTATAGVWVNLCRVVLIRKLKGSDPRPRKLFGVAFDVARMLSSRSSIDARGEAWKRRRNLPQQDALFITIYASGFGITAGVHRLWSHRAFKAKWPLRLILMLLFTISGQRDIYTWALDHRVHHKYSETDADPHNAKRGFFFAHVGWLVLTPHPDVVEQRIKVDMNDLEADPVVMWQRKFYYPLFAILTVAFPVWVPYYFWNESLWTSLWIHFNTRFCVTLNIAFFVNSVAHMYGMRPYDKHISPTENVAVSIAALGEGWHNYHHVFPYDYKTGELGSYTFNLTTAFIDFFAKLGWAYDCKTVPPELIKRKKARSGDGSTIWGWGDRDMPKEELKELVRVKS